MFETAQKLGITVVRIWAFNDGDTWNALQPRMSHIDERVLRCRLAEHCGVLRCIYTCAMHTVLGMYGTYYCNSQAWHNSSFA